MTFTLCQSTRNCYVGGADIRYCILYCKIKPESITFSVIALSRKDHYIHYLRFIAILDSKAKLSIHLLIYGY